MSLQPLHPYIRRVFREHLLEYARHVSVGRRRPNGVPCACVGELRAAEAHGQGMRTAMRIRPEEQRYSRFSADAATAAAVRAAWGWLLR